MVQLELEGMSANTVCQFERALRECLGAFAPALEGHLEVENLQIVFPAIGVQEACWLVVACPWMMMEVVMESATSREMFSRCLAQT